MSRHPRLLFLAALLAGLALGLGYAWVVAPQAEIAHPADLSEADRTVYVALAARAYAADQDLEAAQARLRSLGEPAAVAAGGLEAALAAGQPFDDVQKLAALASALGSQDAAAARFAPVSPVNTSVLVSTSGAVTAAAPVAEGGSYRVVGSESLCEGRRTAGRLEVTAIDAGDTPLPGVALRLMWDGGSDRFITGVQPAGDGYADFRMNANTRYSLAVEGGPVLVDDIRVGPCADGTESGWRVVLRRVE